MKGLFIPGITTEMFRNGCLESIEALMAEGEIYDIDYPCEDCVSRQAVLDIVNNPLNIRLDKIIKKLPPVTLERPKGKWIDEVNDFGEITAFHCSRCYEDTGAITSCKFDFCPHCGADMREVSG